MEATKTLVHSLVSSRVDINVTMQQHFLRSHKRCPTTVAIRSQCGGQADHEHQEIRPHHACAQGSVSLASHSPTHHLQNCNLRSEFIPLHGRGPIYLSRSCIPISVIGARPHLCSAARGHLTTTSNQDTSLRTKKLPCIRTGCVELAAQRHCKSRTVTGTFQDWIENSSISSGICLAALTAPM